MALIQAKIPASVIQNINVEVLEITTDKLETKLHRLLPKTDRWANWISVIGVLVSIILGVISYFCVDEAQRPSAGLIIPLICFIIIALIAIGYIIYRSHTCLNAEYMLEELKDGSMVILPDGTQRKYRKRKKRRY